MKNNTKVRLHLSKKLFESLTKEIIKEAKANDGYTVAVKQPKTPKQSKSQATSPEVQKTDAEAMMGEAGAPPVPPLPGQKPKMPPVPGNKPSAPAAGMSDKSKDATREAFFQVIASTASLRKHGILDDNDISKLEDLANKAMDGLKEGTGKMDKMEEAHDFSDTHNYTYRLVDGNCFRINPETQERAKVHHTYCNDLKKEMEMNVAEEGTLNEIDPGTIDWSVVAAGLGAIGLTPFLIDKIHDLWKKKFPKSFEKAQSLSRNIDKQASGNEPGDKDRQIKTGGF
jgi:hypothetical protein